MRGSRTGTWWVRGSRVPGAVRKRPAATLSIVHRGPGDINLAGVMTEWTMELTGA